MESTAKRGSRSANTAATPDEAVLIRELVRNDEVSLARLRVSKETVEEELRAACIAFDNAKVIENESTDRYQEAKAFKTTVESALDSINRLDVRKVDCSPMKVLENTC